MGEWRVEKGSGECRRGVASAEGEWRVANEGVTE